MRTIICTTGTSVSGGRLGLDATVDSEAYRRALTARVELVRSQAGQGFLEAVSAETKSLKSLQATAEDEIYFLHTDTEDGLICAEAVAEIAQGELNVTPILKRIKGLQVKDGNAFRKIGVDQLFVTLSELTAGKEYGRDNEVVLNITGGFKSVVPYVTLFGLLRRFDITYIFEGSSSLIRMPPLPVQYDYERIGQALEAIRLLRKEGVLSKETFFELIPGLEFNDRRWYECLLEEDPSGVTLSAFAEHLLGTRDEERLSVSLHPDAQAALEEQGTSISAQQFAFMLDRVADVSWRAAKRHAFKGTDLEVYKPGNTPERMAGFTQGRTFFACQLYASHDKYEQGLPQHQRSDYSAGDFRPWVRPVTSEPVPETEQEMALLLRSRMETAETRVQNAKEEASKNERLWFTTQMELEAERERFQTELKVLNASLSEASERKEREHDLPQQQLDTERERLQTELVALNAALNMAQAQVEQLSKTAVAPPGTPLELALAFAAAAFPPSPCGDDQVPPLTRLHATAALVGDFGGTEEQMIVAVLHHAFRGLEEAKRNELSHQFGPSVAAAVQALGLPIEEDWSGLGQPHWRSRRKLQLSRMAAEDVRVKLVWAAAQLRAAQALLRNLRSKREQKTADLNTTLEVKAWYFARVLKILRKDWKHPILADLKVVVRRLNKVVKNHSD